MHFVHISKSWHIYISGSILLWFSFRLRPQVQSNCVLISFYHEQTVFFCLSVSGKSMEIWLKSRLDLAKVHSKHLPEFAKSIYIYLYANIYDMCMCIYYMFICFSALLTSLWSFDERTFKLNVAKVGISCNCISSCTGSCSLVRINSSVTCLNCDSCRIISYNKFWRWKRY